MEHTTKLEVIQGKRVRPKVVLNDANKESIADRFLDRGASLATLAWETGHSQHRLCEVIAEISRAEGIRIGINQARFSPSPAAARRAA